MPDGGWNCRRDATHASFHTTLSTLEALAPLEVHDPQARSAGEQGREVLAVPGSPFDPRAAGPNALIRDGAVLIRGADDVLEALRSLSGHMLREPTAAPAFFTQEPVFTGEEAPANLHDTVVSHLSFTPITVDELLRACHVTIPVLQTILLELELAGRIKRLPGNRVSLLEE